MGQASFVSRMRTGDIRSVPLGVWFFGLLAIAYAVVLLTLSSTTYDLTQTPSLLAQTLGPLVFATLVAYVSPADKRILWGAALLAVTSILGLAQLLIDRIPGLPLELYAASLMSFGWIFELAGIVLLALGLGGIRTRIGRLCLVLGVAVFAIGDISLALTWINNPPLPEDLILPPLEIAMSFVAGLTTVGWAFLLGAALDNKYRAFAIAAGIFFVLDVFALASQTLLTSFFDTMDAAAINLFFLPFRIGTVVAWLVLFGAAVFEVPRRSPRT